MSFVKGRPQEPMPSHRVLREIYRHFLEFEHYVGSTGKHVIDHAYFLYAEDGETIKGKVNVTISFWDLHKGLADLSPRKREAVFWNVIMDKKQKDVAERMGITTVSVGQYVEQGMLQLSEAYFAEQESSEANIDWFEDQPPRERDASHPLPVQQAS